MPKKYLLEIWVLGVGMEFRAQKGWGKYFFRVLRIEKKIAPTTDKYDFSWKKIERETTRIHSFIRLLNSFELKHGKCLASACDLICRHCTYNEILCRKPLVHNWLFSKQYFIVKEHNGCNSVPMNLSLS